jgi:hypothetical protein
VAIDIRDLEDEVTIYYTCPYCKEVSGIIIDKEPMESGCAQELFRCEHCGNASEVWILPSEEAARIRRLLKQETSA